MITIYKQGEQYARNEDKEVAPREVVEAIIAEVKNRGDEAVREYTKRFDRAEVDSFLVTAEELDAAYKSVEASDPSFIEILKEAAANIESYHKRQLKNGYIISEKKGVFLGQKVVPLGKVGIYIPGGTAAYPSTVLMDLIPAKLAGVGEVILVSPPSAGGKINDVILAAAKIAGADKIFKCGGAQSIAALAYGTESIPSVDKIVGPGNKYVQEAKRQVFGAVDIDMICGPSDICIVAEEDGEPEFIAADMLSQAEHDVNAASVLVTRSAELAEKVAVEIEAQLERLPRKETARASIEKNGGIIICGSTDEAIEIVNDIAPEHLELYLANPLDYLDGVRNAGSVFLGKFTPEPLGDYFAGPNHTLPTGGRARFSSPLSVDDFTRKYSVTYYTRDALNRVSEKVEGFAIKEGFEAHANSVRIRFNGESRK